MNQGTSAFNPLARFTHRLMTVGSRRSVDRHTLGPVRHEDTVQRPVASENAEVESGRNTNYWINLSDADVRGLLVALIGNDFGREPEKRIPEIRESRRGYATYIADLTAITAEDTVLDLGSGCGFATVWLAERAGHVHACDISPAFLSFAARECSDVTNISFHLIEPRSLDCIASKSIDVVSAMSVFIHFNLYDIYWYFREFARVVKPGGRMWIEIADSESIDLGAPNTNGGYFLTHARGYRNNPAGLPGLMQWNSTGSVILLARHFGFEYRAEERNQVAGGLLFNKTRDGGD
jgi:SAM-dependent methyltransferase